MNMSEIKKLVKDSLAVLIAEGLVEEVEVEGKKAYRLSEKGVEWVEKEVLPKIKKGGEIVWFCS